MNAQEMAINNMSGDSPRTYFPNLFVCMWAARMPVEIIIDNWNPRGRTKYRFETFCYGPLSCKLYKAGPNRKVEGWNRMVYVEEDWVDEMMKIDYCPRLKVNVN